MSLPYEARRVLAKVDRGFAHALPASRLTPRQVAIAERLRAMGVLARMPARGRWPERYVVTSHGSHAWGTFRDRRRRSARDVRKLTRKERSLENKRRWVETRGERTARAREKKSESDDAVLHEVPAHLALLFQKVGRGIKATSHSSRAEEFQKYADEHPHEAYEAIDDYTERMIRERERFERQGRDARRRRRGARRDPPGTRCSTSTRVQTLLLSREQFASERRAREWAREHGFSAVKIDAQPNFYRLRQEDPRAFRAGSLRTVHLHHGIMAVVGCPR